MATEADQEAIVSNENDKIDFSSLCDIMDEMRKSMTSARDVIRSLREKLVEELFAINCRINVTLFRQKNTSDFDFTDGISLLSIKHHLMLSYLQSLILTVSRQILGHTLAERTAPNAVFSDLTRAARGAGAGDRIDSMVETRLILEKIRPLEERMKYQIDKLVRMAEEDPSASRDIANGVFSETVILFILAI